MTAILHMKSVTQTDLTGTVTVFNSAGQTETVAATNLLRPSDWNSQHLMAQTISGNTSGQSTVSGITNLVIGATDGVTASLSTAASAATLWLSGNTGGGGGGAATTVSTLIPYYPASTGGQTLVGTGNSTASAFFFPISCEHNVAFNQLRLLATASFISSTVSYYQTNMFHFGLYSRTGDTLSEISSGSFFILITGSSVSATVSYPAAYSTTGYAYSTTSASTTAQAQSLFGTVGSRILTLGFGGNMTLTEGLYYLGFHNRQFSFSANGGLYFALAGNVMAPAQNVAPMGQGSTAFTSGSNVLVKFPWGVASSTGRADYSGTRAPATLAITDLAATVTVMPMVTFISAT